MSTPLRQQIRGGRKGRAERQGLGQQRHNKAKNSDRSATRASSDAGPELAGRESHAAMESPQALIAPVGRIKKERTERQGLGQSPNEKKQDQGGKSSLGQPCCPIAAPLSRVEARPVSH